MARIPSLSRTISRTIPLARGVAERAVPVVSDVVGRVATRLPGRSRSTTPSEPETFTPSTPAPTPEPAQTTTDDRASGGPGDAVVAPRSTAAPSPASIARNVAAPRPRAAGGGAAGSRASRAPRSAPGAKLPVRRANPST